MKQATLALAMLFAGAFSLEAREPGPAHDGEWREFMRRCGGELVPEAKIRKAVKSMSRSDRAEVQARLRRIRLMTEAWARAERQAQALFATRALVGGLYPALRADVRPAVDFIMQMNGFGVKRGVIGRRTGQML